MSDPIFDALRSQDKIRQIGNNYYEYFCPGCKETHSIPAKMGAKEDRFWQWNGSLHTPTFTPSIKLDASIPTRICHHFVTEGQIKYCDDCHHELKGQIVELPLVKDFTTP